MAKTTSPWEIMTAPNIQPVWGVTTSVVCRFCFCGKTEPVGTTPCTQGTREQAGRQINHTKGAQANTTVYARAFGDAARREDIQRPGLRG